MNVRWRIIGELTTTSPLHVGSGKLTKHDLIRDKDGTHCDVQEVVKDYRGRPCIPGTALKGVLRAWAEQMLPARQPQFNRIFGASDIGAEDAESGWAEFCTATAVTPRADAWERFEEYVPYWRPDSLTGIFSHVCIDRQTGTAEHNKLYYEEFVPEGVTFRVEIDATRLTSDEVALLLAVLHHGAVHPTHPCQFGANGANGWGRMTWKPAEVKQLGGEAIVLGPDQVGFDCCRKQAAVSPAELDDLNVPAHVSANLLLACDSPFLVNDASRAKCQDLSDEENGDRTNFTPLKRGNGDIWLPASSFRGALRERAEFLLRSFHPQATGDPNQRLGVGPIERIFGQTSQASRLTIEEFANSNHAPVGHQDFVAIDRFTGGAGDGAKFDASYADRPEFETQLRPDLTGLEPVDIALLGLALRDVCQDKVPLGWGGSKGYGQATGLLVAESISGLPEGWNVPESLSQGELDDSGRKWLASQLQTLVNTECVDTTNGIQTAAVASDTGSSEPEVSECRLTVRQISTGRFEYEVSFQRKGKAKPRHLKVHHEAQIAPELRGRVATDVEVDFLMDGNSATCVRPRGEPWVSHTPVKQGTFGHPYYFLRMEDRQSFTGELADAAQPVGHRRLVPGRYSGTIRVKLTVKTPLLICDDRPIEVSDVGHATYSIRLRDGQPDLASSSVRGMLRSAYEAVTNSRFGVFPGRPTHGDKPAEKHGKRLGFRLPANRGLNTVPARLVSSTTSATGLALELLPGTSGIAPSGMPAAGAPIFAAWCGMYGGWRPTGLAGLSHRAEAWAYLTPWHYRRVLKGGGVIEFDFWNVEQFQSVAAKPTTTPPTSNVRPAFGRACPAAWGTPDWYRGFLCVSQRNMQGKHDERFFFSMASIAPIPVDTTHLHQWRQLIEDYHAQHERDLKDGLVRPPVLQAPNVYSRHISTAPPALSLAERQLQANDLCYAEVVDVRGSWVLKALYPVIISRTLCEASPLDCLPDRLRPAKSLAELSPADRVFGWVNQDEATASGQQNAAYRSHVRLGRVTCTTEASEAIEEFTTPKTLAILGQPKPQQGRFYLGDRLGQTQANNLSKEQAGYNRTNRLRGPKVYPHHAQGIQEQNACSSDCSNQNRSVTAWVKPDTVFEFDLHVTNLSSVELGALVWLLSLVDDQFLRLGLGKPLGFGSIRAEINADKTVIADGAAWIESLSQWGPIPDTLDTSPMVEEFTRAINAANPQLLDSFQKAAGGFGELPIHYPRLANQGSSQGEHFKWFVENERGNRHHALPALFAEDVSLPSDPN